MTIRGRKDVRLRFFVRDHTVTHEYKYFAHVIPQSFWVKALRVRCSSRVLSRGRFSKLCGDGCEEACCRFEKMRRRLRGKQREPAERLLDDASLRALHDEAWSEMEALGDDARRRHMHWVHVRTHNPEHVQPSSFTRQSFFEHMAKVYKDVYPESANELGSILLFGAVAKERHANSSTETERDEHHHCPVYTSLQHYWKPVAKRSLEAYRVKLHAACHEGYTSMYVYVAHPSPKKPVHELDASLWHSAAHPKGETLRKLLQVGAKSVRGIHRAASAASATGGRFRAAQLFELVLRTGVRDMVQLRGEALSMSKRGDDALAEFCTSNAADDVQRYIDNAWAVHEADKPPAVPLDPSELRMQKLKGAVSMTCVCGGIWPGGATYILQNNGEDVGAFCRDVLRALTLGAQRGVNMAIIGMPGSGKSTVLEPLDSIYNVCGKPERDNSFPLSGVLEAEVLLWQEFSYETKICAFEDLLSLMVGERFGIRVPADRPIQHRNKAPMFYTAWEPLTVQCRNPHKMATLNRAMEERFVTRTWVRPLPRMGRIPEFPMCARCFADYVLRYGTSS